MSNAPYMMAVAVNVFVPEPYRKVSLMVVSRDGLPGTLILPAARENSVFASFHPKDTARESFTVAVSRIFWSAVLSDAY